MHALNHQAAMMKAVLAGVSTFLASQRAAVAAAEAGGEAGGEEPPAPPPVGAYSHAAAVEVWMQLLGQVVRRGNWFMTQV